MARGVLADAVVVAIDEAEAVEQRRGARGIVRGRRHPVGQPRAVRRRHRQRRRVGRAEIHRVGEGLAIDRKRDRLAEGIGLQERAVARGVGPEVEPEDIAIETRPHVHERDAPLVGGVLDDAVVLQAELGLEDVGLAGGEPQDLGVLVRDDLEREAIQIRQRHAVAVPPEVFRVAREDDPLARRVGLDDERAEPRHAGRRRRQAPCLREGAVGERGLERVARVDRQRVQHAHAGGEGRRERQLHVVRVDHRRDDRAAADRQRRRQHAAVRPGRTPRGTRTPRRRRRRARRRTT